MLLTRAGKSQIYQSTDMRLVIEPGGISRLGDEADRLGMRRIMLVSSPRTSATALFADARASLGGLVAAQLVDVPQHSSSALVDEAATLCREKAIDGFVAIGGGSASDTAKAIAYIIAEGGTLEGAAANRVKGIGPQSSSPRLPIIAVPTTASAAEVTPAFGIRGRLGNKLILRDERVVARTVLIDPAANTEFPPSLLASTGMNAIAHCLEGLYSDTASVTTDAMALHASKLLYSGLQHMVAAPDSPVHRAAVLGGAHLSGLVLANARVGLHHALCHGVGTLGGISHGDANAIMLPHVLAFNLPAAMHELALFADAIGADGPDTDINRRAERGVIAVKTLQEVVGVPRRLRDTAFDRSKIAEIAHETFGSRGAAANPRKISEPTEIVEILQKAW